MRTGRRCHAGLAPLIGIATPHRGVRFSLLSCPTALAGKAMGSPSSPLCRGPRLVVRSAAMSTLVSPAADAYFRAGAAAPWAPRHC